MIKRCIVSAFTHLRTTAVLKPKFKPGFLKSCVVASACLAPLGASAKLTYVNWWAANSVTIKAQNDCESFYEVSFRAGRDAQLALYKDGTNVNSKNVVFKGLTEYGWKQGEHDEEALHFAGGDQVEEKTFFFIPGLLKDTISATAPDYATVGITGKGYENMSLTSTPSFSAMFCGLDGDVAPAGAVFQWQIYNETTKAWDDIPDATGAEYTAPAGFVPDKANIRVQMTAGDLKVVSSSLLAFYHKPGIEVSVEGTEVFETVQRPKYENEIAYGKTFNVSAEALGACVLKGGFKLYSRSNIKDEWKLVEETADAASAISILAEKNMEYRVVAECEDMRPGHEEEIIKNEETFFVRVRFSWDEGAKVDTLFFDNFGTFQSESEYTTFDGKVFANELTSISGVTNKIDKFWAPDYFESVKQHEYSHNNKLVGPFDGDCATDKYEHYSCWEDGACNGYRIEDGFYAIVPNPDYSNCGRSAKDYWVGYDHTGNNTPGNLGGMLFINCEKGTEETVLFERDITLKNECENTRLLFSAYVNNATAVWSNKPVNVLLRILDSDNNVVFEAPSGYIYPRTVEGGLWANLSFMFSAAKGGKYVVQLVNNQAGGAEDAGNDLLFDDILIIAAYPTVDIYRDRLKTDMSPIDTCEKADIPLFLLNKDDIKKYITNPSYLFQFSKDSVIWKNIGDITDVDNFLVSLNKEDDTYWGTTYFRGIVASNPGIIEKFLLDETPELSCDNVYAISEPFRITYDYSGPVGDEVKDSICAGEDFTITLPSYDRPKYRFVDSYSGDTILNMQNTFTYTVKENDPQDTLFYYIVEQRLGCTDTVKIRVHRRLLVDFSTPDSFVTCLYNTPAQLKVNDPASGVVFTWTAGDFEEKTDVPSLIIPNTLPAKGTMTVKAEAKDYCANTKSFPYSIHDSVKVALSADRADSLFCLSAPDVKLTLTANTTQGAPKTYYWFKNDAQVGITLAPENSFSFGDLAEGDHTFSVKVADSVCNKPGADEFQVKLPTAVREPIAISMTADKAVCENLEASAQVTLQHALKADTTNVKWTVSSNAKLDKDDTLANADGMAGNTIKPVNPAALPSTEKILLTASVFDRVCTSNKPKATGSIDLYKVLDLTVKANSHDGLLCMDNDAKLTLTATVNRGEVKQYQWIADGGIVETGNNPSYSFPVATEGTHTFVLKASDGVCSIADKSDSVYTFPTKVRKPVTMKLTADEAVCEDAVANVAVALEHLLNEEGTKVTWSVSSGNATFKEDANFTSAEQKAANTLTPAPTSGVNGTETISIMASVTDEVCTSNKVEQKADIKLHKKLQIELVTDRTDGLFCMENNPEIKFTVNTIRGEVETYYWFADGVYLEKNNSNEYSFPVDSEGKHTYKVYATDGVCNVENVSAAEAEAAIQTRLPITIALDGNKVICENTTVPVTATLQHLLSNDVDVAWDVTANASLSAVSTPVADGKSQVVVTPVPTTNAIEDIIIKASVKDDVCPAKNPATSEAMTIELHKKIEITLAADGISNNNLCLDAEADNKVNFVITVVKGDPEYFVWSDSDEKMTELVREITLNPGHNVYSVMAYDSVCDVNGAAAKAAKDSVEARLPLQIGVEITEGKNPACMGEIVSLHASVTDPNQLNDEIVYAWSAEKSTTANATYNSVTDFKAGNNIITAYAVAANRICPTATKDTVIAIQDSVLIELDVPSSLCQELDSSAAVTLVVTVKAGKPQGFKWSTGDVTTEPSLVVYPTASTVYSVQALDEVCANSVVVTADHELEVSNMFTLEISAASHEVQMGTPVDLVSVVKEDPNSAMNVVWTLNNQYGASNVVGSAPVGPFQHVINENGSYQFFASADGGHCGTINSNVLNIDVADYYQVPTAFTPYNANPKNNIFMKGYGVEIFNRYQQLVFEGPDGWNGEYDGKLAEPGTYFYKLRKKDGRVLKGTIELVKF